MMQISDYEAYLDCFNRRDYDGVLAHFTEDCEVVFAGYCFKGHQAVRDFYSFFHQHVEEQITLKHFVTSPDLVALEAIVRLTGMGSLTAEMLSARGLGRLFVLERDQVIEMPQFIHYHLRGGKFAKALCSVYDPPVETIYQLGRTGRRA